MDCPILLGARPTEPDVHWLFTTSPLMEQHQIRAARSGKNAPAKTFSRGPPLGLSQPRDMPAEQF